MLVSSAAAGKGTTGRWALSAGLVSGNVWAV